MSTNYFELARAICYGHEPKQPEPKGYCVHFTNRDDACQHMRNLNRNEPGSFAVVEGPDEYWSVLDIESAEEFEAYILE